jgi:hypothetical protein
MTARKARKSEDVFLLLTIDRPCLLCAAGVLMAIQIGALPGPGIPWRGMTTTSIIGKYLSSSPNSRLASIHHVS